ncbi:MAG: MIP/aquaporin family protein [Chitinophagaceae bacterium]
MDNFNFGHHFIGEFIGTAVLVILGNGVVSNVVLNKTKGHNSGWIVITFGWAMAVFFGVDASIALGGSGHVNPAVTLALFATSTIDLPIVGTYLLAQLLGATLGAIIVWVAYKQHFDETEDAAAKLACFSTHPAIRNPLYNFLTEMIGTFILVLGVMLMSAPTNSLGSLNALPAALLVLGIGLSLGGPTGYAINPTRDLGPRIAHSFLPIPRKGNSDWKYAWIPIAGPVVGGLLAAGLYLLVR